jgi:hypothetical protein
MKSDDVVDPGDAALQQLLTSMADHSRDSVRRDILLDAVLTTPPLAAWPTESLDALRETCRYIVSLARMSRELGQLTEIGEE